MEDTTFLESLEDLSGKVAIVTGGASGIGLETTIYLAAKGCTVYAASRNEEKSLTGILAAEKRLCGRDGLIKFHLLDLGSVESARQSAVDFQARESRLDIVVANAGTGMLWQNELSNNGYERVFAANHLGHFVFITSLLDLIERTAEINGEARIVSTSSLGYVAAARPDYDSLIRSYPNDGTHVWQIPFAFKRYIDSKLFNIYFTNELDKRFWDRRVTNIYCNSCHPGAAGGTGLGDGGFEMIGKWTEILTRAIVKRLGNSNADSARTQVYLAASKDVRENNIHGQFWVPDFSWSQRYLGCHRQELTSLAKDQEEQKKLWDFSEKAMREAV